MELQHGRRLTDNDRKHCGSNIDTAAVACLLGYFTSPAAPPAFAPVWLDKSLRTKNVSFRDRVGRRFLVDRLDSFGRTCRVSWVLSVHAHRQLCLLNLAD